MITPLCFKGAGVSGDHCEVALKTLIFKVSPSQSALVQHPCCAGSRRFQISSCAVNGKANPCGGWCSNSLRGFCFPGFAPGQGRGSLVNPSPSLFSLPQALPCCRVTGKALKIWVQILPLPPTAEGSGQFAHLWGSTCSSLQWRQWNQGQEWRRKYGFIFIMRTFTHPWTPSEGFVSKGGGRADILPAPSLSKGTVGGSPTSCYGNWGNVSFSMSPDSYIWVHGLNMANQIFKLRILNLKRVTQRGRVCWRFFHVTVWKKEDARHGNMWTVVGVSAGAGTADFFPVNYQFSK